MDDFSRPLCWKRTPGPRSADIVTRRSRKPSPARSFFKAFPLHPPILSLAHPLFSKGCRVDNFLVIRSVLVKTEKLSRCISIAYFCQIRSTKSRWDRFRRIDLARIRTHEILDLDKIHGGSRFVNWLRCTLVSSSSFPLSPLSIFVPWNFSTSLPTRFLSSWRKSGDRDAQIQRSKRDWKRSRAVMIDEFSVAG